MPLCTVVPLPANGVDPTEGGHAYSPAGNSVPGLTRRIRARAARTSGLARRRANSRIFARRAGVTRTPLLLATVRRGPGGRRVPLGEVRSGRFVPGTNLPRANLRAVSAGTTAAALRSRASSTPATAGRRSRRRRARSVAGVGESFQERISHGQTAGINRNARPFRVRYLENPLRSSVATSFTPSASENRSRNESPRCGRAATAGRRRVGGRVAPWKNRSWNESLMERISPGRPAGTGPGAT